MLNTRLTCVSTPTSLKSIKIDRHGIRRRTKDDFSTQQALTAAGGGSSVNLEAGMELLEHYQRCWKEMHSKTEESAAAAQVL